jgi:RND family efflux transporter MFP subunit
VGGVRRFPARIDALVKAELSFRIPGTIQRLEVKEGDTVAEGQLLVALDPTDYEIAVRDAQATFDRAASDYRRAQDLVDDGFISRSDFDQKEAEWKNAKSALEKATQDLAYTELTAPFDGTVAERYVQRFEEVQAKEPILALHDTSLLEVTINVPENIILSISPPAGGARREPGVVPVSASFDTRPGEQYDLSLREIATRADPKTQTFEVTFTMPAPEGLLVFPGMTATVTADLSKISAGGSTYFLPAGAVTADARLDPFVWVVDETQMRVHKTPVDVGRMSGQSIEVTGGLEPGNRVVVAGVGHLAEDMEVRLLPQREEAEPRPEEEPSTPPAAAEHTAS